MTAGPAQAVEGGEFGSVPPFCMIGCTGTPRLRAPAKEIEANAGAGVEPHALTLEAKTLHDARRAAVAADADLAAGIDDAVPRQPAAVVERAQRVADKARLARETRELRDLAVGCHSAARNARDHRVDPPVTARGRGHRSPHRTC